MRKNIVQAQQWLEKCYLDSALSKITICQWYVDFKCSHTDTNDAECSGRPIEAVTLENIKQVLKIAMDERKLKVCKIDEMVNISTESTYTILHEKMSMKKVFSKWVPHLLTMEQKQEGINDSESCLVLFTHNKQDFLGQFVTMDKTQSHHFTPETNLVS